MLRTFALLLLGFAVALPAAGQITFRPAPVEDEEPAGPIEGHPTVVTLDSLAEHVQVIWRPNSAIPDTVNLDVTGQTFTWTPKQAGVATMTTSNGTSQNVSVRYDGVPASGIFILIIAGTILFGGAGFAMGKLLGGEMPEEGYQMPMDT